MKRIDLTTQYRCYLATGWEPKTPAFNKFAARLLAQRIAADDSFGCNYQQYTKRFMIESAGTAA
jgi:hypothetical protein